MLRTRSKVRVLGPADLPAVQAIIERDPVTHVFVDHRVRTTRLDPRWMGGQLWGYDDGSELVSLCHSAANLVPVSPTPGALQAFAAQALAQGRHCSAILGRDDEVRRLWDLLDGSWGPAREIRARQPFLTIEHRSEIAPDPMVRRVRESEIELLYPASVAMFREELGVSPELDDGGRLYRARVAQLVTQGMAFARFERGEVVFKAEVAAVTPHAAQVQGVWVRPGRRGEGISEPAMAAVVDAVLREIAPVVSLYVNQHNRPARLCYERVGFTEHARFATILF